MPDAARALFQHDWPRNVRELSKVLQAALALAGDGAIDLLHLPRSLRKDAPAPIAPAVEETDDDARRRELVEALRAHRGNVSAVARALGKHRAQIQRWMRRWGFARVR
jgi:transcriptional regulator of acetoin/glycerol metabolism